MTERKKTKQITVGGVPVGGGAAISVQSMCNTTTWDVEATVRQIRDLAAAGCDIVRLAIPDERSALAIDKIKEQSPVPLVAERGIDKIRINPGNIGAEENVRAVAEVCKARNIPIRIGINAGSLERRLLEKYGHPCPKALVESAAGHVALLRRFDFDDICLSMKSSSVALTIDSYRLASEVFSYPLHLGVTETGTAWNGTIQSAVGIGTLLAEGIGDTIRVSLTADPVEEVKAGIAILRALGLRRGGVRFISCPTCGRTEIDLIGLATEVEQRLQNVHKDITVAVMGCVVNGPGEAREADFGIAGGKGKGLLFKKGKVIGTYPYDRLCDALLEEIEKA